MGFFWSFTVLAAWKAAGGFSSQAEDKSIQQEGFLRLITIHSKNKYGYHTRWMSDFEVFLESMLNENFFESSTQYYDDATTSKEIEDMEAGLNGDFSQADVRHLLKDRDAGHHDVFKCTRKPDRVGSNYPKSDALSCYKILPKGQMPHV